MKVVIDTNVVVSAFLSPHGNPAKVLALFFKGELQTYYSGDILAEYEDVLSRPVLKIEPEKIKRFFEIIRETATLLEPITSDIDLPDESDRIFYDTAKKSGAVLITGNIKHYPAEDFVMTPNQFSEVIGDNETQQSNSPHG